MNLRRERGPTSAVVAMNINEGANSRRDRGATLTPTSTISDAEDERLFTGTSISEPTIGYHSHG